MKRLLLSLFLSALCVTSFAQGSNIPVMNAKLVSDIASDKIVVKEPKVQFTSVEEKVFAVVDGIIRAVSNFNVVIEANGMYYVYQDVRGIPEQLNAAVKRGDHIGTMYFNDDKKVYSLYLSVMSGPKKYLTHREVLQAINP